MGTYAGHTGHRPCASFVVERVPPQGAPTVWEPKGTKRTVLIPGPLSVDDWLDKLGTLSHAWPQPHQLRSLQVTRVSAQAFEAARVSAAVKHLWPGLRPQWTTIYSTLRLEWPGVYDPSVLHGKFFDNVGQSGHTQDSQYTRANTGGGYFSDFGPIRVSWHEDSLSANLGALGHGKPIWSSLRILSGSNVLNLTRVKRHGKPTTSIARRMAPIVSSAPSERWRRADSQVPGCSGS